MIDITVPAVGESITSGILATWLVQDGQYVTEGQEVFELETDKATMAVPAPASGKLKMDKLPGTEVQVHEVVGTIDETIEQPENPPVDKPEQTPAPSEKISGNNNTQETGSDLTPAVRKMVRENNLDPSLIRGTGPGGRILKEDVKNHLEKEQGSKVSPDQDAPEAGKNQTRVPMTPIRRTIAQRLVASKQNAAHLTTFNEVDMSQVMELRNQYKDLFEKKHGVKLGFMGLFIKASQRALQAFPQVNAFIDGNDILYNNYVDIGVAMSTERGLITPVLRSVQNLSLAEIELAILDYGQKARAKRISPADLSGGTFTISNGGVFGSMLSTPIPNPPQTAVMGMHSIQDRAVVRNGEIVIRPMMYLALTYDHRMIDGKEAISFLKMVKDQIEDPSRMVLDV